MRELKIRSDITCSQLMGFLHQQLNIDPARFEIQLKCYYNLFVQTPPINITDDEDHSFFSEGSDAYRMSFFALVTPNDTYRMDIDNIYLQCNPIIQMN